MSYTHPMDESCEQLNMSVHPNAFIAENPVMKEFCCLYFALDAGEGAPEISGARSMTYGDGRVIFFDGEAANIARYAEFFGRRKCHAGFCGPFARAASAYGCAEKAKTAARLGAELYPDVFLHPYSDVRFWAFADIAEEVIKKDGLSINDFCHSCVFDICEYDRVEGSHYRETLMAYLRAGRSPRAAAELIGVHRNTMAYRIRRMQELFGIDLDDANTCFELLFSFTALEASGIDWEAYRRPEPRRCPAEELSAVIWNFAQHRAAARMPDCICTLFMIDAENLSDEEIAELFCDAEKRFPGAAAAYNGQYVYALAENVEGMIEDFRAMTAECGCPGAVSQPFACENLSLHAELLSHILSTARQINAAYSFFMAKDYCDLSFFAYMQRRTDLEPYYCDEVIRVMDNDYKNGTSFSVSLYRYLYNFTHMNGAAHDASIHRNTIEYQIKKALSAANVNNPDDKLRFEMMCTYKMLIASEE